eukprot:349824-Chlamydomonas_euryale.AAC.4
MCRRRTSRGKPKKHNCLGVAPCGVGPAAVNVRYACARGHLTGAALHALLSSARSEPEPQCLWLHSGAESHGRRSGRDAHGSASAGPSPVLVGKQMVQRRLGYRRKHIEFASEREIRGTSRARILAPLLSHVNVVWGVGSRAAGMHTVDRRRGAAPILPAAGRSAQRQRQ